MDKVFSQMRDVFEKDKVVAEGDVVEQDEVLVQLPHVPNVRDDGHAKLPAKQTHSDEFADAGHAGRVHLDKSGAAGL